MVTVAYLRNQSLGKRRNLSMRWAGGQKEKRECVRRLEISREGVRERQAENGQIDGNTDHGHGHVCYSDMVDTVRRGEKIQHPAKRKLH